MSTHVHDMYEDVFVTVRGDQVDELAGIFFLIGQTGIATERLKPEAALVSSVLLPVSCQMPS